MEGRALGHLQGEVVGELQQGGAAFERGQRGGREGRFAVQGAEQGPAEGGGARRVRGVVRGEAQPVRDVLGYEGAVHGDRERVLGVGGGGEGFDALGGRRALGDGREGALEGGGDGLVPGAGGEQAERAVGGGLGGVAAGQPVYEGGEGTGREVGGGVAVALRGALDGELEHEGGLPADEQPERRRAGRGGRVPGGGVLRLVEGAEDVVGEAGEGGAVGVAAAVEPLLPPEPAVVRAALIGTPVALGGGPAEVRPVHVGRRVPGSGVPAHVGPYEPVEREQRQLRGGPDPAGPGGRPEGVSDGGAEQRAAHPAPEVLLLEPPPQAGARPRPPHGGRDPRPVPVRRGASAAGLHPLRGPDVGAVVGHRRAARAQRVRARDADPAQRADRVGRRAGAGHGDAAPGAAPRVGPAAEGARVWPAAQGIGLVHPGHPALRSGCCRVHRRHRPPDRACTGGAL